jgi:hypothetical protein
LEESTVSKHLIASVGSAVAIALLVAGCGSGDNGSNSTSGTTAASGSSTNASAASSDGSETGSPEKAAFIVKADTICAEGEAKYRGEFLAFASSPQHRNPKGKTALEKAQAEVAEQILIPVKEQEAEELRALDAPSGDDAEVEAIAAALEEGVEKAEKEPQRAVRDGTEAFGKARRLTEEYGMKGGC